MKPKEAPSSATPILVSASALVFVAMLASFTPTPLYPAYQELWHLADSDISLVFAGYPLGVVVVLLTLGGLSDRIGRRSTMLLGLATLALALLILGFATSFPMLVAGRFVHGFASGLITSAAAAALMESHPAGADAGSRLNMLFIGLGVAIGPFLAGSVAEYLPRPRLTPYLMVAVLLIVPLVSLSRARISSDRGARTGRLVSTIHVPRTIWRPFGVAAAAVMVTNLCMGMFGAFGPLIAYRLGWTSEAATGRLVSLVLISLAAAQVGGRRLSPQLAMTLGVAMAVLGWGSVALGVNLLLQIPVVTGAAVLGVGAGLALLGGATLVGRIAPAGRRAEIYAAWLVVAFSTLGATAMVAGPLLAAFALPTVLLVATGVSGLLAASVIQGLPSTRSVVAGGGVREADLA